MEEERYQKFVDFAQYCPKCKFYDTEEVEDPCNDCLTIPARADGSKKPINYQEP